MVEIIPELKNISIDTWDQPSFRSLQLQVDILRLDKIHPEISGNKWFKLKYYLEAARLSKKKTLVSYGGAYSNHILAVSAAAAIYGFSSIGYIRGEEPTTPSPLLKAAKEFGMRLHFLSRLHYDQEKNSMTINNIQDINNDSLFIPEGGSGFEGVRGAEEILSTVPTHMYSHICCAVGTGTTLAGLINSSASHQNIIGVSILKGTKDLEPLNISWIRNTTSLNKVQIIHEDHFGGYARKSKSLLDFMNVVYTNSGIPTDFVYSGKLFYSINRISALNFFPEGSRVLVLHTGGLQGNCSLTPGILQF